MRTVWLVVLLTASVANAMSLESTPLWIYPDSVDYIQLAGGIVDDGNWSHELFLIRPPGYPLLLAAVFAPAGRRLAAARALQALLGGLACVLLAAIGARLFDRRIGLLAGGWFALYPPHAYMAGMLLAENLLLPALLGLVWLFLRLTERESLREAIACGLLAGGCALVKPEAAGVIVLAAALAGRRRGAMLALCAFAVVAPWLLRNHRLSGHWTLSSVGGEAFWGGNNESVLNLPKYRGYWMAPAEMPAGLREVQAAGDEIAQDRARYRLGIDFLKRHPADLPRLAGYKLARFHSVLMQDPRERWALIASYGWLLPFIAAGTLLQTRRLFRAHSGGRLLIALIFYYHLLAVVFWGANRLRLMIDPALLLFGLQALVAAVRSMPMTWGVAVRRRNRQD